MPGFRDISDVWKNLKEVDLRPIVQQAVQPVRIALVGRTGSGVQALATQFRSDPHRAGQTTATPLVLAEPGTPADLSAAELIIIVISASSREATLEQQSAATWQRAGMRVITLINVEASGSGADIVPASSFWTTGPFLDGSVTDVGFLEGELVPAVLEALPERNVALARQLPLFRAVVARRLIEEVSMANATYALTTGLAGIIPLLNIPLNVTDMVVLTKAQAFLAYRLGLALGLTTRWQDYVREFGGVIGGGFMWRQVARMLVGFIPWLGIVPKVGVAYAGTFVVGNVIWHWYLTGRHLSGEQLRAVYRQAAETGKEAAGRLVARLPRRRRKAKLLPAAAPGGQSLYCRFCGKPVPPGSTICSYCHAPVTPAVPPAVTGGPEWAAALADEPPTRKLRFPTLRMRWPWRRRAK
ncbi:MAG: hypothetical protein ACYCYF_06115 [Anaerolineae bacterium]